MEYCDLHCDTPLRANPIINNTEIKGLSPYINFAFCFLHNETIEEKKNYFETFLHSELLKNDKLKYVFSLEGLGTFKNIDEVLYFTENYNIKIISLVWNEVNQWACGAVSGNHGITDMAKDLIKILNEKNIIFDISHANENSSKGIFNLAKTVIATHSNFYTVHPHPRNLKDWQLEELHKRDSIVGLNMYNKFLGDAKESLFKHIEYAINKGYKDLLAFGSDFDGIEDGFINSPKEIPELYKKISIRFSEDIAHIIFNNKKALKIFK